MLEVESIRLGKELDMWCKVGGVLDCCFRELVLFIEMRIPRGRAGLGEINQEKTFQEVNGCKHLKFTREV